MSKIDHAIDVNLLAASKINLQFHTQSLYWRKTIQMLNVRQTSFKKWTFEIPPESSHWRQAKKMSKRVNIRIKMKKTRWIYNDAKGLPRLTHGKFARLASCFVTL